MRRAIIFYLFSVFLISCSALVPIGWEIYSMDNVIKPGTSIVELISVDSLHCYLIGNCITSGADDSSKNNSTKFKTIVYETRNGGKIWNIIDSFNDAYFVKGEESNGILTLIYMEPHSEIAHIWYKCIDTPTRFIEFSKYPGFVNYAHVLNPEKAYVYASDSDKKNEHLYYTDNKGVNWVKINMSYDGGFLSCENEKMFFVGSDKNLNNNLIIYDLSSRKEKVFKIPDTIKICSVQYFNNNYYLFCSEKKHCSLWKINDGRELTMIHKFGTKKEDLGPFAFYCFKNEIIAIAISIVTSPGVHFFKSTDSGRTWIDLDFPFNYNIGSVSFNKKSGLDIWITGGIKELLRYHNN